MDGRRKRRRRAAPDFESRQENSTPQFLPTDKTVAFSAEYEGPTRRLHHARGGRSAAAPYLGRRRRRRRLDARWPRPGPHASATPLCPTPSSWPSTPTAAAKSFRWPKPRKAAYTPDGKTLFFTRLDRQPSSDQALPRRHRGEYLALRRRCRSRAANRATWKGTSHNPDVLEWARLLPLRSRRRDEHLFAWTATATT